MTISKRVKQAIELETKHKKEIDFLKSLGPYRMYSSYYSRQIQFDKELSVDEVKRFLEIIPGSKIAGDFCYAEDFTYDVAGKIEDGIKDWLDENSSLSANGGADGNHFSGWH